MAKRRSNVEGTVTKRPSGKYQAQININGDRFTKTFDTNNEAIRWLREIANKIDAGISLKRSNTTVEDFMKEWLEIVQPSLQPKTHYQYEGLIRNYVLPKLENIKLGNLKAIDIQSLYSYMRQLGAGARTIQLTHSVLRNSLGKAKKWGLLANNPTSSVDRPTAPRKEMRILSENEVTQLIVSSEGHWIKPILHLALATGMRQGELLGLQWLDIDWALPGIHVRRQLQRIANEGLFLKSLKTKRSNRTIRVGRNTLDTLMSHRDSQEVILDKEIRPTGSVFCRPDGTYIRPRTLHSEFKGALGRARLTDMPFHALRHTYASHMLTLDVPIANVSHQLGHANLSTTLNTYGHLIPGIEATAVSQFDEMLVPITAELQRSEENEPLTNSQPPKNDQIYP